MKVMLVDDEANLRDAIGTILRDAGYEFVGVADGDSAFEAFRREEPDLVLLDIMLPGMDGFEVCEYLRAFRQDLPIIILSAKNDMVDKRVGFRAGADDYIAKPFDAEELLLRVGAALRRKGASPAPAVQNQARGGDLLVDLEAETVLVRGQEVRLTAKEFAIVALLWTHRGTAFSNQDVVDEVWGSEYSAATISVPAYVRHIRQKIEVDPSNPKLLRTVFGFGYKM